MMIPNRFLSCTSYKEENISVWSFSVLDLIREEDACEQIVKVQVRESGGTKYFYFDDGALASGDSEFLVEINRDALLYVCSLPASPEFDMKVGVDYLAVWEK